MAFINIVSALGQGILRAEHDDGEAGSAPGGVATTVDYVVPDYPDVDIASLAMPSNVADVGEQAELTVTLGWPEKQYFRTRPKWCLGSVAAPYCAIKLDTFGGGMGRRRGRDKWRILAPPVVPLLQQGDYQRVILHAAITVATPGQLPSLYLMPVRADGEDGWAVTARSGVAQAQAGWIRLASGDEKYTIMHGSTDNPPLAMWPAGLDFDTFVKIALKDKIITDANHPVIRGLLGKW